MPDLFERRRQAQQNYAGTFEPIQLINITYVGRDEINRKNKGTPDKDFYTPKIIPDMKLIKDVNNLKTEYMSLIYLYLENNEKRDNTTIFKITLDGIEDRNTVLSCTHVLVGTKEMVVFGRFEKYYQNKIWKYVLLVGYVE